MLKTKKWIIGVIFIVLFGGIAIFWFASKNNTGNFQTDLVKKGEIKKTISITGSLVSESPIALNFENSGRLQEIRFEVGDKIIEGDVIAVLDNNVLSEQVKKAKAALEKAQMVAKMNDDSAREALEAVDNAEDYLDAIQDYYDQVVDAAEVAYQNALDYTEDAEDYYDQIVDDSGISSAEAKYAKLALTSAENAEKTAEEALETARKNREVNVVAAENSVDSAEEGLESVESDYAESSLDASVKAAEADYQIALKSLENASLKSPLNGVVSKINYEVGEVIGTANLGTSFGEMITNDFILEADIPESDVSEIELGQLAEVTFDAFDSDNKLEAEIIEIDPASTLIQDVVYYKAKLKLKNPNNLQLKEGMSADIDVLIDEKESALKILDQFIYEKETGEKTVKVLENGIFIDIEVQLGIEGDDGYTEIVSGLDSDQEVYFKEEE